MLMFYSVVLRLPPLQFQIDGNLGYVAAVGELLLQSHIPGHLLLLPALPIALAEYGHARGLRGRGDVEVSMAWRAAAATAVVVRCLSAHPWHVTGVTERVDRPGFFQTAKSFPTGGGRGRGRGGGADGDMSIRVVSPNALRLVSSYGLTNRTGGGVDATCARFDGVNGMKTPSRPVEAEEALRTPTAHAHWTAQRHVVILRVVRFPCEIHLCPASITDSAADCEEDIEKLLHVDGSTDSSME